jgi:hypothetical protein
LRNITPVQVVLTVGLDADDFDFFTNLDDAALDTTGHHGATTRDREHVFDRQQEGQIDGTLRGRDVGIQRAARRKIDGSPISD